MEFDEAVVAGSAYVPAYNETMMSMMLDEAASSSKSGSSSGDRSPRSCLRSTSSDDGSVSSSQDQLDDSVRSSTGGGRGGGGRDDSSNDAVLEDASPESTCDSFNEASWGEPAARKFSSANAAPDAYLTDQLLSALNHFERQQQSSRGSSSMSGGQPGDQQRSTRRAAQREQRRAGKIVTQIDALASMLEHAQGTPVSSSASPGPANSKSSVLTAVIEYIRLMEERNTRLQSEHSAIVTRMDNIALQDPGAEVPPPVERYNSPASLAPSSLQGGAVSSKRHVGPTTSGPTAKNHRTSPRQGPGSTRKMSSSSSSSSSAASSVVAVSGNNNNNAATREDGSSSHQVVHQISPVSSDDSVSEADNTSKKKQHVALDNVGFFSRRSNDHNHPDYKLLFMHSPVPMAVCGVDGTFSVCNGRFTAVLGTTAEALKRDTRLFALAADPSALRAAVEAMVLASRASKAAAIPTAEHTALLPNSTIVVSFIRPASLTVCLSSELQREDHLGAIVVG